MCKFKATFEKSVEKTCVTENKRLSQIPNGKNQGSLIFRRRKMLTPKAIRERRTKNPQSQQKERNHKFQKQELNSVFRNAYVGGKTIKK